MKFRWGCSPPLALKNVVDFVDDYHNLTTISQLGDRRRPSLCSSAAWAVGHGLHTRKEGGVVFVCRSCVSEQGGVVFVVGHPWRHRGGYVAILRDCRQPAVALTVDY